MLRSVFFCSAVFACFGMLQHDGLAQLQQPPQVVQLPTLQFFSVNTAVMVPDGGTAHLGGIRRSAYGANSRGVPGLSNLPYANRLFKNRGIGRDQTVGNMSVNVQVISLREMEAELLSGGSVDSAGSRKSELHIDAYTRRKADFITRNVGKGKKR